MDFNNCFRPCRSWNVGSNNQGTAATQACHTAEHATGSVSQSVCYPISQEYESIPEIPRPQLPQCDVFPNFNPSSMALGHFMYNKNQEGQGRFPFDSQGNLLWSSDLPSSVHHREMQGKRCPDHRGLETAGLSTSGVSLDHPSLLPLPESTASLNSFVYPISSYSSSGRSLLKKPRKQSLDSVERRKLSGVSSNVDFTSCASSGFPLTSLKEGEDVSCSGTDHLNEVRHQVIVGGEECGKKTESKETTVKTETLRGGSVEESVNLTSCHQNENLTREQEDLVSNTDSSDNVSEEEDEEDGPESESVMCKVEPDSHLSSEEHDSVVGDDEPVHAEPSPVKAEGDMDIVSGDESVEHHESELSDPVSLNQVVGEGVGVTRYEARQSGRCTRPKRHCKRKCTSLMSPSTICDGPLDKLSKHHMKVDHRGNELCEEASPVQTIRRDKMLMGIGIPKVKKKQSKIKPLSAGKRQSKETNDAVICFVEKHFCCGHCCCEFRNCEKFLRHYVMYHNDFFSKNLRNVYNPGVEFEAAEVMELLLECKICETLFVTEEERTAHLNNKHRNSQWQCLRCGMEFGVLHEWNEHLLSHRPDQKYKCSNCTEEFDSVRVATEHFKTNHEQLDAARTPGKGRLDNDALIKLLQSDDYGQKCPHCNRYFDMWTWPDAYGHKQKFLRNDPQPFKCVWCPRTFLHNEPLIRHIRDHPPFFCPHCDSVKFDLKGDLQLHLMTHLREKNYIVYNCKICENTFSRQSDYVKHMNRHYGKTFPCPHCDKAYISKRELKLHLLNHTGTKPFICDTCGKQFKEKRPLVEHIRIHTGERPFQCKICAMTFPTRSQLRQHRKHNHEERKFKCDKCDWKFPNAYLLNRHYKKHTGNTGFRCEVCFKDLYDKVQLEWHMNTHTGNKPFKCRFCDRAFCAGKSLYIHERTVHKEQVLAEKLNNV